MPKRSKVSSASVSIGIQKHIPELPLSDYSDWFEAIRCDDNERISAALAVADDNEKYRLLNGRLQFFDIASVKNVDAQKCSFTHTLVLAAAFGSLGAFDVLLEHGADVFALEDHDYNLVHSLVCVAFYEPDQEDEVCVAYRHVSAALKTDDLRRLLTTENRAGFRPLEFAVQQGTIRLMSAILDTADVYKTREEVIDVTVYQWFDVTEYVGEERRVLSPLSLMLSLDQRSINEANRLFCDGIFKDWVERYMRSNGLLFAFGFVMRIIYIAMLYVYEMDRVWLTNMGGIGDEDFRSLQEQGNATSSSAAFAVNASFVFCQSFGTVMISPNVRLIIFAGLLLQSAVVLTVNLLQIYATFTRWQQIVTARNDLNGRKRIMITRWHYFDKGCNFTFVVLVVAELLLLNETRSRNYMLVVIDIFRLVLTLTSLWNLMVYLQILPGIGQVVIYIREMTPDLASFIVMFCFYTAIFARQFILFFNVNSKQGCIRDFSSFPMAMYSLYLTMLNMEDYTQFDVYAREILYIHHFAYVAVVGIMLLNLLIAVFSNTLSKVKEEKEFTINLSRMNVILDLCRGLEATPFANWIYGHIYRASVKRNFICEGERVFLINAKNIDHRSDIDLNI